MMKAWLPTYLTQPELEGLMRDPRWVMQDKADGKHVLLHVQDDRVFGTNREGAETRIHPSIIQALRASPLRPVTILDGEQLHEGPLVLFDVLSFWGGALGVVDLRGESYGVRWTHLSLLSQELPPPFQLVRCAFTEQEKFDLLEALMGEQAEGVVFKRIDARYTEGRPVTGGTMRKLQFRKRADVIVQRRTDDSTRSFDMFAFSREGEIVGLGSVSARHFYEEIAPGGALIAEVEYLYSAHDDHLVQPVLMRFRDDKRPEECGVQQLVRGKRFRKTA